MTHTVGAKALSPLERSIAASSAATTTSPFMIQNMTLRDKFGNVDNRFISSFERLEHTMNNKDDDRIVSI